MENKDAVIALDNGTLLVLLYRKLDSNYVAHSGLIVHPDYRNLGLAKK
jgi:ribosomal protein S18 acetylase RimI-like enzyme